MTPVQFLGIDAGNSAIKWAYFDANDNIRFGSIPNVAGPAIQLDFPPSPSIPSQDVMAVTIENGVWSHPQTLFLGNLALTQLQDAARQDRSRDKVNSDNINLFVPAILGLLDDGRPIVCAIGATLTDYAEQAPEISHKLTGKNFGVRFLYGSKSGKNVRPDVTRAYTYAQCAGGLLGLLRDAKGTVVRTHWNDKTVLGIDIGHGQINVAPMQKLQFVKSACFSTDYGFYRVASAVQDVLSHKPYYVTASIPQLQKAVEDGFYMKNNNAIDLVGTIDDACRIITEQIHREIVSKTPPALFDSINDIVLMGGGARRMENTIKAKFGLPVEVAVDSMYANAKGLLLVAREKWGKENGV